jgi:hypothetical protein
MHTKSKHVSTAGYQIFRYLPGSRGSVPAWQSQSFATTIPCTHAIFDEAGFFGGEVVELVDEVVDLGFEGLDVGRRVGLLGREDAVDERFNRLLLLIRNLLQAIWRLRLGSLARCFTIERYRDIIEKVGRHVCTVGPDYGINILIQASRPEHLQITQWFEYFAIKVAD